VQSEPHCLPPQSLPDFKIQIIIRGQIHHNLHETLVLCQFAGYEGSRLCGCGVAIQPANRASMLRGCFARPARRRILNAGDERRHSVATKKSQQCWSLCSKVRDARPRRCILRCWLSDDRCQWGSFSVCALSHQVGKCVHWARFDRRGNNGYT
jgi:hypothetical protein